MLFAFYYEFKNEQFRPTSGPASPPASCSLCDSTQERLEGRAASVASVLPRTNGRRKPGGRKEKLGRKQKARREIGERREGTAPCDSPGWGPGFPSPHYGARVGAGSWASSLS